MNLREKVARIIADAQNVPFVGPKQRRIADALINGGVIKEEEEE